MQVKEFYLKKKIHRHLLMFPRKKTGTPPYFIVSFSKFHTLNIILSLRS